MMHIAHDCFIFVDTVAFTNYRPTMLTRIARRWMQREWTRWGVVWDRRVL